jgi:MFS transporter, MHS family, shikimate and dehydroshikimate transport protein
VVFGHYGDVHGRRDALAMSLCLMGVAGLLMALIPPYTAQDRPVMWPGAWWALLAVRVLQGLAMGGQWGGNLLLHYECCRARRR